MLFTKTSIPDVLLIEPRIFGDSRGYFYESFNLKIFFEAAGDQFTFLQDNQSFSIKGVLRGLHYQLNPYAQGKLVRVVQGEVFDVAVDIRRGSPTFGRWVGEVLSAENKRQLWIPPGFAHGFLTLSDSAIFLYKATNYFSPSSERCILWNDPDIGIDWPTECRPLISDKDSRGISIKEAECL